MFDVLVEERIEDKETFFGLGRCRFQAPEVDGVCVIRFDPDAENAKTIFPGAVVKVRIDGVRGVDLVGVLSL